MGHGSDRWTLIFIGYMRVGVGCGSDRWALIFIGYKSFIFLLLPVLPISPDGEPLKHAEYTGIIIHNSKFTI
jgi:hypothetical protein